MHIFLQGPRGIGKSTVIRNTLDILTADAPLALGGFFTWNGGMDDPHIYMRPAAIGREREIYRIASYDAEKGGMACDLSVFEKAGVSILGESAGAALIIMDELGFLEAGAPEFRRAVLKIIGGSAPVLGVLRIGGIPWHDDIKNDPGVLLAGVTEENRGALPRKLAARYESYARG